MKRIATALLALCLLLGCCGGVQCYGAENPYFQLSEKLDGNILTVTVKLSQTVAGLGGVHFTLSYDAATLAYTEGSRKVLIPGLSNSNAGKDTASNGKIGFVIDNSVPFTITGDIAKYQFKVIGDSASTGIRLQVEALYLLDANLTEVALAVNTAEISVNAANPEVKNVMDRISQIGEVTLESEGRITAARQAYNSLSLIQKRQVSNLQTLVEAEDQYARLLAQNQQVQYELAAKAFTERNAAALEKTVETVAISDKEMIYNALNEYEDENVNVRILLSDERYALSLLRTRIMELEKIAEEAAAEQLLKEEAEKMAAEYLGKWQQLLSMDKEDITDAQNLVINQAIGEADGNALLNSYFMPLIQEEYDLLKEMKELSDNYEAEAKSDSQVMADKFLSSYGYLLEMSEEDVSADLLSDLTTAVALYDMLTPESQMLIGEDVLTKLEALLEIAEDLSEEGNGDNGDNSGQDALPGEDTSDTQVRVMKGKVGALIKWLLIITSVTVTLNLLAIGVLIFVNKSKFFRKESGEG